MTVFCLRIPQPALIDVDKLDAARRASPTTTGPTYSPRDRRGLTAQSGSTPATDP